jgi:hypothetical protein
MERIAESLDQFGFAESGHSFEQDVAFAKNGHQDIVDEIGIPDDDLRNLLMHPPEVRLKRIHLTLNIGYGITHGTKVISSLELKPAGIWKSVAKPASALPWIG